MQHGAMELDVAASIDRTFPVQVIGERLLRRALVDVAHERVGAQRNLTDVLVAEEHDSLPAGVERTPSRSFVDEPRIGIEDVSLALARALGGCGRRLVLPRGRLPRGRFGHNPRCGKNPERTRQQYHQASSRGA
jgi:hypothetical protein